MIYLDLIEKQHHFHTAVQEGNIDGRMCALEFFLLLYFSTNKHNYARYGNWYVYQMRNRDSLHSGNDIIFSVQSQARCNLRTAVDQRGEQSLNKDAKTVGGVRRFSADNDAVTNWTMGRADQAWNLNSLLQTCNIRQQYDEHKHTRPSQILQSESRTSNVVAVLDNDYVNPFDIALDRTMLINLSSGPEMETSTKLLSLQQDGITLERVSSRTKSIIHEKVFWSHSYKHQYVNDGEEKLYHKEKQPDHGWSNRDVLGDLLRLTMKSGQVIDFKEALKYPLSPIPLSLSFPHDTKRSSAKSSLMKIIDHTEVV